MLVISGKSLGCLCIMAAGIGIGMRYGKLLYRRNRESRALVKVLELLYGELEYRCAVLPEAMILCGEKVSGTIGGWFADTGRRLLSSDGIPFCMLWETQIKELYEISNLEWDSMEELGSIGVHISSTDKQTQLQAIHTVCERIQKTEQLQKQRLPERIRLFSSLLALAGAFIIILLF